MERCHPDRERGEPLHVATARCEHLAHERRALGSAATSGSPPCARTQRSYAANAEPSATARSARRAPLAAVDAEVGEREQVRRRVEHELGQIGRPVAAHRLERLAHLERVADGAPERLVHVGEHADDVALRAPSEREHRLGEHLRVRAASS